MNHLASNPFESSKMFATMKNDAPTPSDYLMQLPPDRREAMGQLRDTINSNLPDGFVEAMNYGMIGWVVPHALYPSGYHCNPKEPLPFMSIASQKNHMAFYHMGLYAMPDLMAWYVAEYAKINTGRADVAKSCIRFKKPGLIAHHLIGELVQRMSVAEWIAVYERAFRR